MVKLLYGQSKFKVGLEIWNYDIVVCNGLVVGF